MVLIWLHKPVRLGGPSAMVDNLAEKAVLSSTVRVSAKFNFKTVRMQRGAHWLSAKGGLWPNRGLCLRGK